MSRIEHCVPKRILYSIATDYHNVCFLLLPILLTNRIESVASKGVGWRDNERKFRGNYVNAKSERRFLNTSQKISFKSADG